MNKYKKKIRIMVENIKYKDVNGGKIKKRNLKWR